ncbi:hypothetical protein QR685DRAFT_67543 [Neurospora intermedia]|uniref:Zn(2)-C6 fungal-type domain-containing protein n=1 Tax=Neurospora intermedia TaxID=5142 RepID=A0ABR3DTQ5_NEUIN
MDDQSLLAEMDDQSVPSSSAPSSHRPLQYGRVIEIMPIVCDQCRPLDNNRCNRQSPYCFHCDKNGQVCSYTGKLMDACRPCRFNMGLATLKNCDRKVPRCTMCEFEGLACWPLDTDNIEYNTKCNQCRARNRECVARQDAEQCEFCKSKKLLCTYLKARRSVPE